MAPGTSHAILDFDINFVRMDYQEDFLQPDGVSQQQREEEEGEVYAPCDDEEEYDYNSGSRQWVDTDKQWRREGDNKEMQNTNRSSSSDTNCVISGDNEEYYIHRCPLPHCTHHHHHSHHDHHHTTTTKNLHVSTTPPPQINRTSKTTTSANTAQNTKHRYTSQHPCSSPPPNSQDVHRSRWRSSLLRDEQRRRSESLSWDCEQPVKCQGGGSSDSQHLVFNPRFNNLSVQNLLPDEKEQGNNTIQMHTKQPSPGMQNQQNYNINSDNKYPKGILDTVYYKERNRISNLEPPPPPPQEKVDLILGQQKHQMQQQTFPEAYYDIWNQNVVEFDMYRKQQPSPSSTLTMNPEIQQNFNEKSKINNTWNNFRDHGATKSAPPGTEAIDPKEVYRINDCSLSAESATSDDEIAKLNYKENLGSPNMRLLERSCIEARVRVLRNDVKYNSGSFETLKLDLSDPTITSIASRSSIASLKPAIASSKPSSNTSLNPSTTLSSAPITSSKPTTTSSKPNGTSISSVPPETSSHLSKTREALARNDATHNSDKSPRPEKKLNCVELNHDHQNTSATKSSTPLPTTTTTAARTTTTTAEQQSNRHEEDLLSSRASGEQLQVTTEYRRRAIHYIAQQLGRGSSAGLGGKEDVQRLYRTVEKLEDTVYSAAHSSKEIYMKALASKLTGIYQQLQQHNQQHSASAAAVAAETTAAAPTLPSP